MPVDPGHHRLLHGRGTRPFHNLTRYTPLASSEDAGGSTGSTPTHSPGVTPPGSARAHTEVRLGDSGRPTTHLRPPSTRTPIQRPCNRHRGSGVSAGGGQSRYTKLGTLSEEDAPVGGGSGILRAVTSRGRGYEDLRCRGAGGDAPDSADSSAHSTPKPSPRVSPRISPRSSPPNGRKRHSGILITSALARSGIKRLSRVSFGSSKGSMVETLIYDSPVAEEERIPEEEVPSFRDPVSQKFGTEIATQQKPASKVRVTFYESSKPLVVTSPEPSEFDQYSPQDFIMASPLTDAHMAGFDRQLSSDSGRDNPFRPDGDISREADEIVQLIKSGRPLMQAEDALDGTCVGGGGSPISPSDASAGGALVKEAKEPLLGAPPAKNDASAVTATASSPLAASPTKAGANGSAAPPEVASPGTVEVTHATVTPTDPGHVEHVVIRKKSKCNCCVIQ